MDGNLLHPTCVHLLGHRRARIALPVAHAQRTAHTGPGVLRQLSGTLSTSARQQNEHEKIFAAQPPALHNGARADAPVALYHRQLFHVLHWGFPPHPMQEYPLPDVMEEGSLQPARLHALFLHLRPGLPAAVVEAHDDAGADERREARAHAHLVACLRAP